MNNNQMTSDMRKIAKAGRKEGWSWELNKSQHFVVLNPKGKAVTTVAPRSRHWLKDFMRQVKGHNYPGFK